MTAGPVYNVVPAAGRAGPLRPRTRRQRSLPRRPTSPGTATTTRASRSPSRKPCRLGLIEGADPQEPPRLRRPLRRRHLHHHPQHLPRRGRARAVRAHLLDLPAAPPPTTKRRSPGYQFPQSAEPPLRVADPARHLAERLRHDPLRTRARRRPRHGADRLARRRPTVDVNVPHIRRRRQPGQLRHPGPPTVSLPVGMGLNPSAANGLQTCTDAQFGKGTANPAIACPAGLEDRHGRRSNRRRCRKAR